MQNDCFIPNYLASQEKEKFVGKLIKKISDIPGLHITKTQYSE